MKSLLQSVLLFLGVSVFYLVFAAVPNVPPGQAISPTDIVRQAWQQASQADSYQFRSRLEQTLYPAKTLANAGQYAATDHLIIEGETNRAAESLLLRLRRPGDAPERATEVRMADGQTSARVAGGEWQPLEEQSGDLFGPGQDPLNYLAAVKNVQPAAHSDPADISLLLAAEHFTFEIDGPAYAALMRDELQAHLLAQGELPPGVTIAVADQYRDMTAEGELWLDEAGLPLRLALNIVFPPEADGSQTAANLQTDFFDFVGVDHHQLTLPARVERALSRIDWRVSGVHIALFLGGICLIAGVLFIQRRRARLFYNTTVSVVILSMLATPLLQSAQAANFFDRQATRRAEYETQRAEQLAQASPATPSLEGNPTLDPLSDDGPELPFSTLTGANVETTAPTSTLPSNCSAANGADTDQDGLTDALEARYGSSCTVADTDGDTFSDALEVYELGTDPTLADSDGDGLSDPLEVASESRLGGDTDPLQVDTNYDGIPDGAECQVFTLATPPADAACPDTDGDGHKDIVDDDNDNDGLIDRDDASPYGSLGSVANPFTQDAPFALQVDGVEADRPLFVDFQLQTVTATHMTYPQNILDWPSGDTKGQVQRYLDTTFANTANTAARISGARGDLQLVPLLEITIPDAAGNYGNLPVLTNPTLLTAGAPITGWLDIDQLNAYGISVNRASADNTDLIAYVPLQPDNGSTGGERVALTARMFYHPRAGTTSWGNAHQLRLLWLVQMLTDECDNPSQSDDYCHKPENRRDKVTIIHSYYDDWYLTGLNVREDHGLDMAIAFEDPAADQNLNYDANLWQLANGLSSAFIGARVDAGGARDMTISAIKQRFDSGSNGSATAAERWGIPQNALRVETFSYPHQDDVKQIVITETARLLANHFGADTTVIPTLLFAQESHARLFTLNAQDTLTSGTNSFQVALGNVPVNTLVGLKWAPLAYDDVTSAWVTEPLTDYQPTFTANLAQVDYFKPGSSADSKLIAAGRQRMAWNYYQTLNAGLYTLAQVGQTVFTSRPAPKTDDALAAAFTAHNNDGVVTKVSQIGSRLTGLAHLSQVDASQDIYRLLGISLGGGDPGSMDWTTVARRGLSVLIPDDTVSILGLATLTHNQITTGHAIFNLAKTYVLAYRLDYAAVIATAKHAGGAEGEVGMGEAEAVEASQADILEGGALGVVGFVVTVGIIWHSFASAVKNLPAGSPLYTQALVSAIAATVVAIVLLVLSFVGFGALVAIIALIDGIFMLLCVLGVTHFMCGGITGEVTKALADAFYHLEPLVNLSDRNRLQITYFGTQLGDDVLGFQPDNTLTYNATVSNTLKYSSNLDTARRSTFEYELQTSKIDIESDLGLGQMTDDWGHTGGAETIHIDDSSSLTTPLPEPGINRNPTIYLTEGFAVPARECWRAVYVNVSCDITAIKFSNHIPVSEDIFFDIFPNSLSEFHQLSDAGNGQFALSWGNNDDISFPVIWDADGDGLGNRHAGGADPNDSRWDTDGDGLSDAFELANGTAPALADPDGDTLNDRQELIHNTKPYLADSDGDGLTDDEELLGWSVVYSDTLTTWVRSDPLVYDTDGDGLNDFKEKLFGFNPRALSNPQVLDYEVQIDRTDGRTDLGAIFGSGDTFDYTATVHSRLANRDAQGLLSMNPAPAALTVQSQPQNFFLSPYSQQQTTMTGSVTVNASASTSSGVYLLGQTAGATIRDPGVGSNYAQVWLTFDGSGGIADFDSPVDLSDHSGQLVKNNGTCNKTWGGGVNGDCYSSTETNSGASNYYSRNGVAFFYGNVTLAHTIALTDNNNNDFTAAMWVYDRQPYSIGENQIVFKANNASGDLVELRHLDTSSFKLTHHDSGGSDTILNWTGTDGQWYHLALMREGNTLKVYINGSLSHSMTISSPGTYQQPVNIRLGDDGLSVVLDEFYMFTRALTSAEINNLKNQQAGSSASASSEPMALRMPLDEVHGDDTFDNKGNKSTHGSCSGSNCPVTGVPGVIAQSALFNGHNRISIPLISNNTKNFVASAWVNWDGTQGDQFIFYNGNSCESNGYGIGVHNGTAVAIAASGWDNIRYFGWPDTQLTPNRWHHIIFTVSWDGSDWSMYLDGQKYSINYYQQSYISPPSLTAISCSSQTTIGAGTGGGYGFTGYIDDVQFYESTLDDSEIADLYHAGPLWQLHLDEAAGSTSFTDIRGSHNAACTNCPVSGESGQIFGAAGFNGGQTIATDSTFFTAVDNLTMMAWVKWDGTTGDQTIIYNGSQSGNNGYGLALKNGNTVSLLYNGVTWGTSSFSLVKNQWYHVALTRADGAWRLYVNGDSKKTFYNDAPRTPSGGALTVGYHLHGAVDEPALYQRALSEAEMKALFLAQNRWVQEENQFGITVDTTPPTVEFLSYNPAANNYRASQPVQLAVSAIDDYAGVSAVSIAADGASLNTKPCDGASGNNWCAWFPAPGDGSPGEGAHTVTVSATDRVDNTASAQSYTLYVDDTPPAVSITDPGQLITAIIPAGRPTTQQVRLSGTVSDPAISGTAVPGSGSETVQVTLLNPAGNLAGDAWQAASITGATWTLDYTLGDITVAGAYTVTAAAVDQLGNRATAAPVVIQIDSQPPTATLQTSTLPTATIVSGSLTLTGTTVEQPLTYTVAGLAAVAVAFNPLAAGSAAFNDAPLTGLTAHWTLDDNPAMTGTLTLRDISGNGHHGECDTCPDLGQTGHVQSAARFDGSNDAVTLPTADQLGLTNHDFTVSAWVKLADTSGDQVILGTDTMAANQGLRLMASDGAPVLGFYGNDLSGSQTLQPGQWYHLVWRYTKSTNEQAIFVNSALDTSEAGHAPFTGTGPVYLGRAWAGTAFNGLLDEVQLYNRALSANEIAGLYRGSGPLLWLKLDVPSAVDGAAVRDDSDWGHHGQLSSGDSAEKAGPGAVGPFALSFDGVDDTLLLPSAVSSFTPPQFSAAFWVKIGDTFAADTIVAKGNAGGDVWSFRTTSSAAGQGRGVSFNLGASSPLASQWGDNEWHHVAGVYNSSQQILYVDGVEAGRGPVNGFNDTAIALLSLGANQSQPTAALDGQIDDVRYYPRAITPGEVRDLAGSNWRAATLSASGSGVRTADWSFPLPAGLEGLYRLDLQPTDQLGNRGLQDSNQWAGLIDTLAPRVDLTSAYATVRKYQCYPLGPFSWSPTRCAWVNDTDYNTFNYSYRAEDFNLSTLSSPCDNPASTNTYYQSPWYREMAGGDNRLYQIGGSCNMSNILPANFQVTACDAAGNCATATAPAVANAALLQQTDPDPLYTEVVSPTANSLITNSQPVSLTVWGVALNYLQAMTVSIDSVPTYSATWTQGEAITATGLLTNYLFSEGTHQVQSTVRDWLGDEVSHTITVTVDTLPPQLALNTDPLTRTHYHPGGLLDVSGWLTDTNAIAAVQVRLSPDGAWSSPANLTGNRWIAPLILPNTAPDGVSYTLNARAIDIAGRETVVTGTLWVDVVAPPPITLTLRADGVPVSPGETVRAASPTLSLSWGDNSFAADALWHTRASHQDWLTVTVTGQPAGGTTSASFSPGEAEQVEVTLIRRDALGNERPQRWGVLTVDAPTTPDFVSLPPAGDSSQPAQSWLDSGCTLLSVDRRADRRVSQFHARDGEQRVYASWDSAGLRLAWQGANWAGDGDLFVYLDTKTGGATQVYNPFTDGHTVHLPADFAADTLVWVQNETDAALLHWDGGGWGSTPLTADQYHFEGDQTDLYLPFADLGLTDPATTPVRLLAFATEEDALELWAALPPANPLNSPLVSDHAPFVSGPDTFGLSRAYAWAGLGAGLCPNAAYPDIDLTFNLTADPTGTEYAFLGDNLHFLWDELMNGKTADVSSLFAHTDASHPPLAAGQAISYTLTYHNRGTDSATNVTVDVAAVNGLQLAGGNRIIAVGDVGPEQAGSVDFAGQIDLSSGTHDWANLEALVYSDAHPAGGPPLEWLWLDHEIDHTPPVSLTIRQPVSVIGPGATLFSGTVYDASPPVNLTLGSTLCPPAQADGRWRCEWNANGAADGQEFNLSLHATDAFGQAASSAGIPFVVDSTPPDITVSTATLRLSNSFHTLSGQVSDNHGLGEVSVCWALGECGLAALNPTTGVSALAVDSSWSYALPLPAGLDGVTHTVTISATDGVGNQSQTQTEILVDTVPPAFSANQLLTEGVWLTDTLMVLAGTVSDGSGPIEQINVLVTGPDGRYVTLGVDPEAGAWAFNLRPDLGGLYTLWATAQDAAGNRSVQGPYFVEAVVEPTLTKSSSPGDIATPGGNIDYLLEIRNTSAITIENITVTDPLPAGVTPTAVSGGTACLRAETGAIEWQPFSLGPNGVTYLGVTTMLTGTGVYSGAVISNTAVMTTTLWGLANSNTDYVTIRNATPYNHKFYFPIIFKAGGVTTSAAPAAPQGAQSDAAGSPLTGTAGPYTLYLPLIYGSGQSSLPLCQ